MERLQHQVHIPHSQGQHEDNTIDQLIEADITQPDESSVNTSPNGSESESLNGNTDAFLTHPIAEISISNISNSSQANLANTTFNINNNDNLMSRRSLLE